MHIVVFQILFKPNSFPNNHKSLVLNVTLVCFSQTCFLQTIYVVLDELCLGCWIKIFLFNSAMDVQSIWSLHWEAFWSVFQPSRGSEGTPCQCNWNFLSLENMQVGLWLLILSLFSCIIFIRTIKLNLLLQWYCWKLLGWFTTFYASYLSRTHCCWSENICVQVGFPPSPLLWIF